jgi:hypothetical protein
MIVARESGAGESITVGRGKITAMRAVRAMRAPNRRVIAKQTLLTARDFSMAMNSPASRDGTGFV